MRDEILQALGYLSNIFKNVRPGEDLKDKLALAEKLSEKTDWKDKHHLRYCSETYLDRRFLPYKTAVNMRDIGGYTTNEGKQIKWKKIYRGEEICHLSPEDQEKFDHLGITHVFDFRSAFRIAEFPDHVPPGALYTNIPVMDGLTGDFVDLSYPNIVDQFMRNIYVELVEKRGYMFAEVIKVLADKPDCVIYIHCENGKDRTGLMAELIELLMGIPINRVISDYSLSNQNINRAFNLFDGRDLEILGPNLGELLHGTIGVDPDWLELQLRYINETFEGIEDYLLRNSLLTKEDFEKARNNVLIDV